MNKETQELIPSLSKRLLDEMCYGIIVSNPEGKFVFWNKLAYKIFNKDLIKSPQEHWVADWGLHKIDGTMYKTEEIPLSRALKGEFVKSEKLCIKIEGSKDLYLKVSAYPIFCEDEPEKIEVAMVMFEDITNEQIMYDNVIEKINELEIYLKAILDFNITKKHDGT